MFHFAESTDDSERPETGISPWWNLNKAGKVTIIFFLVLTNCAFIFSFSHPFFTPKILCFWFVLLGALAMTRMERFQAEPSTWILVSWPLIALFWTKNIPFALTGLMAWLTYFGVLITGIRPNGSIRLLIRKALCVSGVLVSIYGICQVGGWDFWHLDSQRQATSFFGNANFSAHFMLFCLTLGRFPKAWLGILAQGILMLGIIICGSKLVWLVLACLVLLKWFQTERYRLLAFSSILLLGMVVTGGIVFSKEIRQGIGYATHPADYVQQFRQQPRLIVDRDPWFKGKRLSLMTRVILYSNATTMVPDFFLIGAGFDGFYTAYPRYANSVVEDPLLNEDYRAHHVHNFILEGAINFGLVWLFLFLFILGRTVKRMRAGPFRQALLAQFFLAMASLNYLNPMVILHFVLLRPAPRRRQTSLFFPWVLMPLFLVVGTFGILDIKLDSTPVPHSWTRRVFPEERGAEMYAKGDYANAFAALRAACLNDPVGPESMFNVSQTAMSLARRPQDNFAHLGIEGLVLCTLLFPNFEPPKEEIERLSSFPFWQEAVKQRNRDTGYAPWERHRKWISTLRSMGQKANSPIE